MSATQVTTWRRYTAAEKKAYQARRKRRSEGVRVELWIGDEWRQIPVSRFHLADNYGSRVPTARVNGEGL